MKVGTILSVNTKSCGCCDVTVISEKMARELLATGSGEGYTPLGNFIFRCEGTSRYNAIFNEDGYAWMPDNLGTPLQMLNWLFEDEYLSHEIKTQDVIQ